MPKSHSENHRTYEENGEGMQYSKTSMACFQESKNHMNLIKIAEQYTLLKWSRNT